MRLAEFLFILPHCLLADCLLYDQQIAALERNAFANQRRLDLSDLRYRNGGDSYPALAVNDHACHIAA
jgi:hypothetical protein